ncbi:hypothetical protein [Patiriisocius sp. Uisw_017]|jgi:hypothetical protein|uniref:hypothetical protein n=1 Tax=Patiriisocius sp. Uisw_017 TaxID=3230968 RepID=UPI0039EC1067
MKYSKILIGLFLIIATLLLIDIFTGIFYWNRLNLLFDSSIFNNITTAIIGVVSFMIYSLALFLALFLAFKQNKTILSQHLRPYYEREINRTINELEKEKIDTILINTKGKEYNGINYPNLISDQLMALTKNTDYLKDITDYDAGIEFKTAYIKERSYYPIVAFLSEYTIGLNNKFRYDYLKEMIEEIDEAKLLNKDKIMLKKRIKKEILSYYISFINFEQTAAIETPPIPNIYDFSNRNKIEFKKISDSYFKDHYDWFKEKLK